VKGSGGTRAQPAWTRQRLDGVSVSKRGGRPSTAWKPDSVHQPRDHDAVLRWPSGDRPGWHGHPPAVVTRQDVLVVGAFLVQPEVHDPAPRLLALDVMMVCSIWSTLKWMLLLHRSLLPMILCRGWPFSMWDSGALSAGRSSAFRRAVQSTRCQQCPSACVVDPEDSAIVEVDVAYEPPPY
jgi:hypothetical protein